VSSPLNYRSPREYEREWERRTVEEASGQAPAKQEAMEKMESPNRFPLSHSPGDEIHSLMGYGF
jgi:hypothetical protein